MKWLRHVMAHSSAYPVQHGGRGPASEANRLFENLTKRSSAVFERLAQPLYKARLLVTKMAFSGLKACGSISRQAHQEASHALQNG